VITSAIVRRDCYCEIYGWSGKLTGRRRGNYVVDMLRHGRRLQGKRTDS
jgi:hypothetical protein